MKKILFCFNNIYNVLQILKLLRNLTKSFIKTVTKSFYFVHNFVLIKFVL